MRLSPPTTYPTAPQRRIINEIMIIIIIMLYVYWTCKAVAADKKKLLFHVVSSRTLQKGTEKQCFLVHSPRHFSFISIFLHINFYYNGGIACGEERHHEMKARYDGVGGRGNQDKYEWKRYFIMNEAQTITLFRCSHPSRLMSTKPHHKHFHYQALQASASLSSVLFLWGGFIRRSRN